MAQPPRAYSANPGSSWKPGFRCETLERMALQVVKGAVRRLLGDLIAAILSWNSAVSCPADSCKAQETGLIKRNP